MGRSEKCEKMNCFKEACRSSKGSVVHNIEKEDEQDQETDNEMVNINLVGFNSNHSTIIANLKTPLNKVVITMPYKVDTDSNGNIMPIYMYKNYFLGQQLSS